MSNIRTQVRYTPDVGFIISGDHPTKGPWGALVGYHGKTLTDEQGAWLANSFEKAINIALRQVNAMYGYVE